MRDCLIHWEDYYNSSIDFDNEVDSPRGKVVGEKVDTKDISPPILVIVGLTWQVKLLLCVIIHVPEWGAYHTDSKHGGIMCQHSDISSLDLHLHSSDADFNRDN